MSLVYELMTNGTSNGDIAIQSGTYKLCLGGTIASGASIGLEMLLANGSYADVNHIGHIAPISLTDSTSNTGDCFVPQGIVRVATGGTVTGLYVYLIRI